MIETRPSLICKNKNIHSEASKLHIFLSPLGFFFKKKSNVHFLLSSSAFTLFKIILEHCGNRNWIIIEDDTDQQNCYFCDNDMPLANIALKTAKETIELIYL